MCEDTEDILISWTDFYWHHGDYPRIISLDRIITEIDPQDVETYSTGGWLMDSDGDKKDAEAYYQVGVSRNPTSSYMAYQLGMFYYNSLHHYQDALAVFSRSVKLQDAGVTDWKMLAHTYERLGDYHMALQTWQETAARFPHGPAVDVNLNRVKSIVEKQNAPLNGAAPTGT